MTYQWKFTMGTKKEPVWEVFSGSPAPLSVDKYRLIAYAKRAKKEGWFVRISGLNGGIDSEKIYIGDDVFPPDFMKMMLEMNKNENA
jgi:hypothetical protein